MLKKRAIKLTLEQVVAIIRKHLIDTGDMKEGGTSSAELFKVANRKNTFGICIEWTQEEDG